MNVPIFPFAMKPLIDDVIVPVPSLSLLERIKTWLGRGDRGVAASLRRMGVDALAAELIEAQHKIDKVTGFAQALWERHFRDEEMPSRVIHVSRVNYLVGQVLNGGFLQFVRNSRWNRSFVGDVRSGLAAIGAQEHLAVLDGAARMIEDAYEKHDGMLDTGRFQQRLQHLEEEHFSNSRLSRRLSRSVDDSWKWGDRWASAQLLSARYIAGWRDVRRVPSAFYYEVLDELAQAIPDLKARRQMREDARPWEKKAIERLVARASLSDVWYTAFSAREHDGRKVWCWNFTVGKTPGEGHHQVVFVDGEAIMFKGVTDEIVARMPVPECAPGSGFARNEPGQDPEDDHPNITLLISNP